MRSVSCLFEQFEFHFLRLHIAKTNQFCIFVHNERVPALTNRQDGSLKHSHNTVPLNTSPPTLTDFKS